nr:hypothetical protein [Tanacetum cinerariifolium]
MIDKVIHTMKTDIVKLVVKIKGFGMSSDEFDKETGSSDGLQRKQADLTCVHTLNEIHFHEIHVVPILSAVGTTADLTRRTDFVHLSRFHRSKMSFHQALDLIFELNEAAVRCSQDIFRARSSNNAQDSLAFVTKLTTGRLVNGSSYKGSDMVIKYLDLEPKIDAMTRDFLDPYWWKELSKETSSKILDGPLT